MYLAIEPYCPPHRCLCEISSAQMPSGRSSSGIPPPSAASLRTSHCEFVETAAEMTTIAQSLAVLKATAREISAGISRLFARGASR